MNNNSRWNIFFIFLISISLLTACEAMPTNFPGEMAARWEQAVRNFWDDSFGKLINPVLTWIADQYRFVAENAPELPVKVWNWIVDTAQGLFNEPEPAPDQPVPQPYPYP